MHNLRASETLENTGGTNNSFSVHLSCSTRCSCVSSNCVRCILKDLYGILWYLNHPTTFDEGVNKILPNIAKEHGHIPEDFSGAWFAKHTKVMKPVRPGAGQFFYAHFQDGCH